MKYVKPDFIIMDVSKRVPIGFQRVNFHMIFDVKMEDFRRKSRLVAGGHTTKPPATITYASILSSDTVKMVMTLAELNDL